jgi:DNA polymerase-3 subunit epsilon
MAELDWLDLGFDGRALGHLVSQCGWFYEGHRAENDILALIYLLAHEARGGQTVLAQLMAASGQLSYRVNAVEAPFEAKDMLNPEAIAGTARCASGGARFPKTSLRPNRHG